MLVGRQLGPFHIDKELGSGAMGTVYRGRYVKTGQVVAIKVMSSTGTSSASAVERFEREAEILRQLKHPNIVRLFGVNKAEKMRYYAMEYIEGQSLDRVMVRRDRMDWEEVVELGKQLCAALQHAHDAGIVHRDLKPSNLMVLADGTLKLTDFGIAKDLDETNLTATNCTVGTAAYMSPEQCRGERNLTHKSDLYSLGIVFYELLTGKKPFHAESPMEMFLLHVQGPFERPSRLVPDLPVWLDNLVCQLMEKKPEHRPYDAAMVGRTLATIQEKVEARQSAGLDVARARLTDLPRGKRNPDEEDKDAARTLLSGQRGKKRGRKKGKPNLVWLKVAGLVVALLGLGLVLFLALRPPSADSLYAQARRAMEKTGEEARERARNGPVKAYLDRFGSNTDAKTREVRDWADEYDRAEQEKLLTRYLRWHRKEIPLKPAGEGDDKLAYEAVVAEEEGDRDEAIKRWRHLAAQGGRSWRLVGEHHLEAYRRAAVAEEGLRKHFETTIRQQRMEPTKLAGFERQAFVGLRFEKVGDRRSAAARFAALKEEAAKDEAARLWYLLAAYKKRQLDKSLRDEPQTEKERNDLIEKTAKDARGRYLSKGATLDVRAVLADLVELYGDGKKAGLASLMDEVRPLFAEVDGKLR